MKKLLSLLGAIGLVATTSATVVSCDITKTEVKNLTLKIECESIQVSAAEEKVKAELIKEDKEIESDVVFIFENKTDADSYMKDGSNELPKSDDAVLSKGKNYYYLLSTANKDEIGFKYKGKLAISKIN